ncbi:hypothetical protein YYC_02119 [Plasmodium yoelii 17X]|uniref:YIR protein n=1 Tax=Plasmodium yoelii 17X TaxID=1323249 RepID=V7PPF4_PLAYE|nr:hypothetical protein YYC_02119 [Plasmodium yoelii 17X]
MSIWEFFPDKLTNDKQYDFKKENFLDGYCGSYSCDHDLEKINAGFFYLLNQFFGSSGPSYYAQNNINIVDYIMLWLSYMLSLKEQVGITNLQYFYNTTINNDKYQKSITGVKEYKTYKDLIDKKKYFLDMDSNIISNFYEAFKLLCEMYNNFDDTRSYCSICSENANKFVSKYKEMNQNSYITNNSSYNELLSTLSNDYNNFKEYCNSKGSKCKDYPELPTIKKTQSFGQFSGQDSEDISSSSIGNKLFTVLSIFGVIAFLLGISYKYSLFGFRKRFQKQKLREKIKNIKKRINH